MNMSGLAGLVSLGVLVGVETFAFAAAVLWPIAAGARAGRSVETAALVASGLLGVWAAAAIMRRARRVAADE